MIVNNIQRTVYISPKPNHSISQVMDEFDSLRKEWKIGKYMCKEVKRGYAFDEQGVSRDPSASFLKVIMSAKGNYLFYFNLQRTCHSIFQFIRSYFLSHIRNSIKYIGEFPPKEKIDGTLLDNRKELYAFFLRTKILE